MRVAQYLLWGGKNCFEIKTLQMISLRKTKIK